MRKSVVPFGSQAAESVASRTISLPIGPHLDELEIQYVAKALNKVLDQQGP
jgi:dTDP-4-amino-4,6-dideoxygalactose transaminase